MSTPIRSGLILGALAITALPADCEENNWFKTDFNASAGIVYDSNVGIQELDQSSGEGDEALAIELGAKLTLVPTDKLTLRAGYTFDATEYQSLDVFSLQTHLANLEGEYDFDVLKAGILYTAAHARLDGDGYLDFTQLSPNVSKLFGNKLYIRAAYLDTEKNFKLADGRDASGQGGQVDAYILLDGMNRYIALGAKNLDEDAQNNEFDLTSTGLKARYVQKVDLVSVPTKLRFAVDAESKDYDTVTEAIGEVREDDMLKGEARAEFKLAEPLGIRLGYAYTDRSSNLPSANYGEHLAEAKLIWAF